MQNKQLHTHIYNQHGNPSFLAFGCTPLVPISECQSKEAQEVSYRRAMSHVYIEEDKEEEEEGVPITIRFHAVEMRKST